MKKPDQKERSLVSDIPLAMAAEACSRTPKCMLRPPGVAGCRSPAPLKSRRVKVEGSKSAAPPSNQGTASARMLRTLPDDSRLAMPLASAGKTGSVQPMQGDD